MAAIDRYTISADSTLLDAIKAINDLAYQPLTLMVVDAGGRMAGTLTDGDIRRAIVGGVRLEDPVSKALHAGFRCLRSGDANRVATLREFRLAGIKLVPELDADGRIVDLIDLTRSVTKLPVDAVIMAGGKGERLRPLTEKTPKPLLPVGGKAIIDHNVDRLINYGVEHISVTTNYLKEQLHEHFSLPRNGVKIATVDEPEFLGTIGSIKFVEKFYNDTVLVMNSDIFTELDFEDFYLHFRTHNADMSVAAVPYSVAVPYGIMDLDGRELRGMIEKPTYNYYANGGVYLIKREMLDLVPEGKRFNATDLIVAIVKSGHRVIRFPINGTWIDIGNHEEYRKANDLAKHMIGNK